MIARFGLVVLLASVAMADTVSLRNGDTVEGTFLGGDSRQIRIATGDRIQTFSLDSVSSIQFGGGTAQARPPAPLPNDRGEAPRIAPRIGAQERDDYDRRASNSRPEPTGREIPAGTNFVIRMIDGIDSE